MDEEPETEKEEKELPGMKRMRKMMERLKHPRIRIFVEDYYDTQDLRIAEENRLRMYRKLSAKMETPLLTHAQILKLEGLVSELRAGEKLLEGFVRGELKDIPVWKWLKTQLGMGPCMAGGLIAWIDDVRDTDDEGKRLCPHPSSLHAYAGLNVIPYCPKCDKWFAFAWDQRRNLRCRKCGGLLIGRAPKRVRGMKAPWNERLRKHMWKVVKQFLMAGKRKIPYCPRCDMPFAFKWDNEKEFKCPKCGEELVGESVTKKNAFYCRFYDQCKAEEIEKCERKGLQIVPSAELPTRNGKKYEPPGVISTGHVDNRAKRKVAKVFLTHLWLVWREMEGLPVNPPYSAKMGHKVIPPPNWPLKGEK